MEFEVVSTNTALDVTTWLPMIHPTVGGSEGLLSDYSTAYDTGGVDKGEGVMHTMGEDWPMRKVTHLRMTV